MPIDPLQNLVQKLKVQLKLPDSVAQEGSRFKRSRSRFQGGLSQVDGLDAVKRNRTKKPHQK